MKALFILIAASHWQVPTLTDAQISEHKAALDAYRQTLAQEMQNARHDAQTIQGSDRVKQAILGSILGPLQHYDQVAKDLLPLSFKDNKFNPLNAQPDRIWFERVFILVMSAREALWPEEGSLLPTSATLYKSAETLAKFYDEAANKLYPQGFPADWSLPSKISPDETGNSDE